MQLIHKEVPEEFLRALPEGIKYVQRAGQDFLVIEALSCPEGHSLMANQVRLHGEPSICLQARIGRQQGRIFVDSFWGSHDKLYSFLPLGLTPDSLIEASCPHCGTSLMAEWHCGYEGCAAERGISMILPGGVNRIIVCNRLGCPEHELQVQHIPEEVRRQVRRINYFGETHDLLFQGI